MSEHSGSPWIGCLKVGSKVCIKQSADCSNPNIVRNVYVYILKIRVGSGVVAGKCCVKKHWNLGVVIGNSFEAYVQ